MVTNNADPTGEILMASDSESTLLASDDEQVGQDALMLASDDEALAGHQPNAKRDRFTMTLLGMNVCLSAFQALLGVGSSTLQRLRRGEHVRTNRRRPKMVKHPLLSRRLDNSAEHLKWPKVLMFLWLLYQSSAEILPTRFVLPNQEAGFPEEDEDFSKLESSTHSCGCFTHMQLTLKFTWWGLVRFVALAGIFSTQIGQSCFGSTLPTVRLQINRGQATAPS